MKKWIKPEIYSVNINKTAYDWAIQASFDGGYLGDGLISGWFGDPEPATTTPAETPATPETPAAPTVPVAPIPVVDVDELS